MASILAPRPLVEVDALNHYYGAAPGGHLVLDDVNLTLMENEIVGLLGRSGSGKSTLLRSIAGLIHPREGEVRFNADETGQAPTVSMVFQTFALVPPISMTRMCMVSRSACWPLMDAATR